MPEGAKCYTYRIGGRLTCALAAALLGLRLPGVAFAQRVDDNVITNANDAFGQSVGNERVGLYGTDDLRVYLGHTVRRQNRQQGGNFKPWIGSSGLALRPYAGASVIAFWGRTRDLPRRRLPAATDQAPRDDRPKLE